MLRPTLLTLVCVVVVVVCLAELATGTAKPSYYELLGVDKDASPTQIKRAFRRMALKYHPDRNPSPTAQAEFIAIARAYETLMDDASRQQYDTSGGAGFEHDMPGAGDADREENAGQDRASSEQRDSFTYSEFFHRFDEVLKQHFQAHLGAVRSSFGDSAHDAAEAHMREHLRLHQQAQGAHVMSPHHTSQQAKTQSASSSAAAMRSDSKKAKRLFDGLFDDLTEDEEQQLATLAQHQSRQTCRVVTKQEGDTITTVTECVNEHS